MDDKKPHRNWSLTINDKDGVLEDKDIQCAIPGWKLEGQWEIGNSGTRHFQGYLNTPPVRFSAVKREFPRAHIEIARDVGALKAYVHKDETRVSGFQPNNVPNMFDFQRTVSAKWDWEEFNEFIKRRNNVDTVVSAKDILMPDDLAMEYLDSIVSDLIEEGAIGIEFIAINPMWRSSWKRFWKAILRRNKIDVISINTNAPQERNEIQAPQESPHSQECAPTES